MSAGKHRKFRSGYPSTYDAWPVMAEHQPQWQQKLSGVSP